jgi:hypothetical protein
VTTFYTYLQPTPVPPEPLQQAGFKQSIEPLHLGLQCLRSSPRHRFPQSQVDHLHPRSIEFRRQFLDARLGPIGDSIAALRAPPPDG